MHSLHRQSHHRSLVRMPSPLKRFLPANERKIAGHGDRHASVRSGCSSHILQRFARRRGCPVQTVISWLRRQGLTQLLYCRVHSIRASNVTCAMSSDNKLSSVSGRRAPCRVVSGRAHCGQSRHQIELRRRASTQRAAAAAGRELTRARRLTTTSATPSRSECAGHSQDRTAVFTSATRRRLTVRRWPRFCAG